MKKIIKLTESDLTRIIKRVINEGEKQYYDFSDYQNPTYDEKKEKRLFRYMDISFPIDSFKKIIHPSYPNITFYMRGGVVIFAHLNEKTPDGKTWFWFKNNFWSTIEQVLTLTYWEVTKYLGNWFNKNLGTDNAHPTTGSIHPQKEFDKVIKNIESGDLEPINYKKIRIPKNYSNLIDDMGSMVKVDDIIDDFNKVFDAELPPLVSYNSSKKVFINSYGEEYPLNHVFEILDESYN